MINNLKIQLLQRLIYFWDVLFTSIDLAQLRFYMRMKAKLGDLEENSKRIVNNSKQKVNQVNLFTKNDKYGIINKESLQRNWDNLENKPKIKVKRGCGGLK